MVRRAKFNEPKYGFTDNPKNDFVIILAMLNIEEMTEATLIIRTAYVLAASTLLDCFFVYSWY